MNEIQFNNALTGLKEKLRYYALSLTADHERANDLLQETMLKALTYRDKFTQNTNFKAWLYTIMKNTFINDYRKSLKIRNTFNNTDSDFQLIFSKDKVYPAPDSFFHVKEIHKSIDELEEEYRVPFRMFLDGYKYKEIAEKLDLPLGTVKSRIFFTRKKLSESLQEYSDRLS
jgi:RNA polymerase sigma factor (sigma-70 family)